MAVAAFTMGTTTWSTFWAFQPASPASAAQNGVTYAQLGVKSPVERGIARVANRGSERAMRRILYTLIGAVAGGTATEAFSQVDAPTGLTNSAALGGLRTINSVNAVNRVTTSADVTYLRNMITDMKNAPAISAYPADISGNGGGGKAGK